MKSNGPTDWLLALVGVGTIIAALRTLKAIERQVKANETAAEAAEENARAAADNAAAASSNAAAAEKMAALMENQLSVSEAAAEAAKNSAITAVATLDTNRVVERAYVALSHIQPGLTFHGDENKPPWDIRVTIAAINSGNTPAHVVACKINIVSTLDEALVIPEKPPAVHDAIVTLMPRDKFFMWTNATAQTFKDCNRSVTR